MSLKHGVYAQEKATSLVTPLVADVGIPFVVGAAPVQSAGSPARSNVPVLCTSWDEAVAKLGFSYDWEAYPICEFMYSHYDGVQHDYTRKQGLVWQQVFLPDMAPAEWADREILWNAVE